jgi:predicted RNase H-like HicB family nuclease
MIKYAHIPDLPGVWATGKTLEDCRNELISVIEGWIALRLRMGDPIPTINGHTIVASSEPVSVV